MKDLSLRRRLIFGAFVNDKVGQEAISVVRKKGYPVIDFKCRDSSVLFLKDGKIIFETDFSKKYPVVCINNMLAIFVCFFTAEKGGVNNKKRKRSWLVQCTAHKFTDSDISCELTPLRVCCNPLATKKQQEFEKAVEIIAGDYFSWAVKDFPVCDNGFFPPWGIVPQGQHLGHQSKRVENFQVWKESVVTYLNST